MKLQISLPITSREPYDPERLFRVFAQSFKQTVSGLIEYRIDLGIDEDDPQRSEMETSVAARLAYETGAEVIPTILSKEHAQKICRIWTTLAMQGYRNSCECYLLAGDDLEFITPLWDVELCAPLHRRGYGLEAFWDLTFPNFPTFPIIHRAHLDCFGRLFPAGFENANQAGDPYLFALYEAVGAARLRGGVLCKNHIGGFFPSRYFKVQPNNFSLQDDIKTLQDWITVPHLTS